MCIVFSANKFRLMNNKLRRNNAAVVDKFRSRNDLKSITKHNLIVHAASMWIARILGSCSKEICRLCCHGCSSNTDKVCFLCCIVCLITIHDINIDATVNNTTETVISCEDQLMKVATASSIVSSNLIGFGSTKTVNLTTVNMHDSTTHMTIEIAEELLKQLISKKNTRSNNNNCLNIIRLKESTLAIFHHDDSLSTTSRNIDATFVVVLNCVKCSLLMRTKLHDVLSIMQ